MVTEAEAAAAEVNYYITISIDVINKSIFFKTLGYGGGGMGGGGSMHF